MKLNFARLSPALGTLLAPSCRVSLFGGLMDNIQFSAELAKMHASHLDLAKHITHFLEEIFKDSKKARQPAFQTIVLGKQPYILDYKERKHVFVFNYAAAAVTLTTSEGINISLPPQVWTNIGFRPDTQLSSTATTALEIKCTDEVQP
jgi:hypothetical protein